MCCRVRALVLAGALACGGIHDAFAGTPAQSLVAPFSAATPGGSLPAGWTRADIKGVDRPTAYRLVGDEGVTVLRADAQQSASALVYKVSVPPGADPLLQWKWKVSDVLKTSNPATKEGDDYAARVYVMFDYPLDRLGLADRMRLVLARAFYDPDVPAAALCYVWDSRLPAGTVLKSPYTSRVRIIVADSGPQHAGQWRTVERDVAADYRQAFGEEPPAVSAVALATDTDNTRERVTAWYGDIVLKKRGVTGPAQ